MSPRKSLNKLSSVRELSLQPDKKTRDERKKAAEKKKLKLEKQTILQKKMEKQLKFAKKSIAVRSPSVQQASKLPCSLPAVRSYAKELDGVCYTMEEMQKMVNVIYKYIKTTGTLPPNMTRIIDFERMKPNSKETRTKKGLIKLLAEALGPESHTWHNKLPYENYMENQLIRPKRSVKYAELEVRNKIKSVALAGALCDLTDMQAGMQRLSPGILYVGLIPNNSDDFFNIYTKTMPEVIEKAKKAHKARYPKSNPKFLVWTFNPVNHWTTLINDKRNGKNKFYYIDSFGSSVKGIPDSVQKYIKELDFDVEKVIINTHKFQTGGSECGIWAIFFAFSLFKGDSLEKLKNSNISDDDMKEIRKKLFLSSDLSVENWEASLLKKSKTKAKKSKTKAK